MTLDQSKLFQEGREMMHAFHWMNRDKGNVIPTQSDIERLARQLDLRTGYVSKRIWTFLQN
jgi:hypothetical protein